MHLGKADAPATLVEIADLQCPFCAQYSRDARCRRSCATTCAPARSRYELRFRSFLGRDSVRAAGAAADAAKQNLMYQFADVFYRNQGPEESGYADADVHPQDRRARSPGLDPDKVAAAADDPLSQPAVRANEQFARDHRLDQHARLLRPQGRRLTPLARPGHRAGGLRARARRRARRS